MYRFGVIGTLFAAILFSWSVRSANAHTPAEAMAEAANQFLASLDADQRKAAEYEFKGKERENWNFIPMDRPGLALKQMQPHQQHLAMALLHSALSHDGFSKAVNIMTLEQILHVMENNAAHRDPSLYHVYIFGTPSTSKSWGWRVEGHHLSINVTLVEGQKIVATPAFFGANPGHVKQGPREGLRVLRDEEDLARALLLSLDDEQKAKAVINVEAPSDVINGPGRKATPLEPKGLSARDMTEAQRRQLIKVVREYVHSFRREVARDDMKKIREAGVEKLTFAWAGGDQPGQPHYYRIEGPSFIFEYDNTQNDANHIHAVWRDFKNDFGADLLKQHYEAVAHE